jgi:hypothetical protein
MTWLPNSEVAHYPGGSLLGVLAYKRGQACRQRRQRRQRRITRKDRFRQKQRRRGCGGAVGALGGVVAPAVQHYQTLRTQILALLTEALGPARTD